MIVLIGQILGCLLVAAGIGGVVGWLLRQISPDQHTQEFLDITTALRLKEQMLEKVQYELKVQAAGMKILESKILEAEELNQSTSQELSARNDRLKALQEELAVRTQRLMVLEAEEAAVQRRVSEYDAAAAAQSKEIQQLHLKCKETQQTLESNEEERCDLQRRIAELESTVAEVIGYARAWRSSNRPKDGSIGWKCNSVIETVSIEPRCTNSTANWPNETGASASWSRSLNNFRNKRRH
jgi:hypothetical protein